MRPLFFLGVLCFLLNFSLPAMAGQKEYKLKFEGYERRYVVYKPSFYRSEKEMPVVFVLHGGGGKIETTIDKIGMNSVADKYGFIVVYPEGIGNGRFHAWNAGHCCAKAKENNINDVGFISEVIERLKKSYAVDEKRIYSTGLSNGAQMSYRLSCELSEKIAAIAPIGAQNGMISCNPKRFVPTIHFHGTEDQCALYGGGENCGGCFADLFRSFGIPMKRKTWSCEPVEDTIDERVSAYSCNPKGEIFYNKGEVTCQRWDGCRDRAEVALCTIKGGGHTWPGSKKDIKACQSRPNGVFCTRWKEKVGHVTQDIDANEAIWTFFSRFSLQ